MHKNGNEYVDKDTNGNNKNNDNSFSNIKSQDNHIHNNLHYNGSIGKDCKNDNNISNTINSNRTTNDNIINKKYTTKQNKDKIQCNTDNNKYEQITEENCKTDVKNNNESGDLNTKSDKQFLKEEQIVDLEERIKNMNVNDRKLINYNDIKNDIKNQNNNDIKNDITNIKNDKKIINHNGNTMKESNDIKTLKNKKKIKIIDKIEITIENRNWNIKKKIEKRNINILFSDKINIKVECNRCTSMHDINIIKKNKDKNIIENIQCNKCKSVMNITYTPSLEDEYLGMLLIYNCKFIMFNSIKYKFMCNCGTFYEEIDYDENKNNDSLVGDECNYFKNIRRELKERCFNCNENIGFKIKNIKYIISSKDNIVLKANTPLPKNGTCVHYKKSYRWFRFPCCNKLYPCDVCHDDNNSKNHLYSVSSNCGLCDVKYTGKSSG